MAITINVNLDEILAALKNDLDFTGNADKYIKVNATADGFEFADIDLSAYAPLDDPTFTTKITTPIVRASDSGGLIFQSSNGTQVADFGAGGGSNATFSGGLTAELITFNNDDNQTLNILPMLVGYYSNPAILINTPVEMFQYAVKGQNAYNPYSHLYLNKSGDVSIIEGDRNSTTRLVFNRNGNKIYTESNFGINNSSPAAQFHVSAKTTSTIGAIIQAAAGQTANLLEVKNSGGTNLFHITASGGIATNGNAGFTGTGSYTNFTIENGIITAAS